MNLLFIGDIFGRPGRKVISEILQSVKAEFFIDICIANCENVASGSGITEKIINQLFEAGIDGFTSGNHLWDNKKAIDFLERENRVCKPLNYPPKAIGAKYSVLAYKNYKIIYLTLIGQAFMPSANSPFQAFDAIYEEISALSDCIIVDFHAEATAEKKALAYHLDGRASCLLGTHTHVQTADEQILEKGTGFITDVGMTGPHDSVIGVKKEIILEKLLTGMPKRYEVAENGLELNAVVVEIDMETGTTNRIERIKRKL